MDQGAAFSYLELLADRQEAKAAQLVHALLDGGERPDSIYTGLFATALDEARRRRGEGRLAGSEEQFVQQATDRMMSILEPVLLRTRVTQGRAVCAWFGSPDQGVQLRIAAALLRLEGYEVYQLGAESTNEIFDAIVREIAPNVCILFGDAGEAAALERAVERVRTQNLPQPPMVIAGGPAAATVAWAQHPAATRVESGLDAVAVAAAFGRRLEECIP